MFYLLLLHRKFHHPQTWFSHSSQKVPLRDSDLHSYHSHRYSKLGVFLDTKKFASCSGCSRNNNSPCTHDLNLRNPVVNAESQLCESHWLVSYDVIYFRFCCSDRIPKFYFYQVSRQEDWYYSFKACERRKCCGRQGFSNGESKGKLRQHGAKQRGMF